MSKNYWLFKTEPDSFSIDDLANSQHQITVWDGIRNYQARNLIRDQIQLGDAVLIYHSSCKLLGIAGTATVVRTAYPDPSQFNPDSRYYDPKSTESQPRWFSVDIQYQRKFHPLLARTVLSQVELLADMPLFQKACRLSIQPVTAVEWQTILHMANETGS